MFSQPRQTFGPLKKLHSELSGLPLQRDEGSHNGGRGLRACVPTKLLQTFGFVTAQSNVHEV